MGVAAPVGGWGPRLLSWKQFSQKIRVTNPPPPLKGGGGQAFNFGKKDFKLGVGGEGQDTSCHFEGSFGSICAILPM